MDGLGKWPQSPQNLPRIVWGRPDSKQSIQIEVSKSGKTFIVSVLSTFPVARDDVPKCREVREDLVRSYH